MNNMRTFSNFPEVMYLNDDLSSSGQDTVNVFGSFFSTVYFKMLIGALTEDL